MRVKIEKDYYGTNEEIYQYTSFRLEPGLTVLVGCNGSGKTTLLHQIEDFCKEKGVRYIYFDNYKDGGANAMSSNLYHGNTDAFLNDFIASEGERIGNNVGRFAYKIGKAVRECSAIESRNLVVLMDAIDSGLSIDGILNVKENLFATIFKDCKQKDVKIHIVATANEFELANGEKCLNVVSGEQKKLNTYNDYKKEVLMTYREKMKRYGLDENINVDKIVANLK